MEEMVEQTIQDKLGLQEDASKKEISTALDVHNRKNRAFSLKLPPSSPWKVLSCEYLRLLDKELYFSNKAEKHPDGFVRHPLSFLPVYGTLIEQDLTPIEVGDLCACCDGSWRKNNVLGLLYRSCSGTVWVRP